MSLVIRYMVCLPSSAMPRFQVPIRPRLCRVSLQINEHWASHPRVFERYARHVDSGEKR